eukprot:13441-Heterococcus_DN1.PRE.2
MVQQPKPSLASYFSKKRVVAKTEEEEIEEALARIDAAAELSAKQSANDSAKCKDSFTFSFGLDDNTDAAAAAAKKKKKKKKKKKAVITAEYHDPIEGATTTTAAEVAAPPTSSAAPPAQAAMAAPAAKAVKAAATVRQPSKAAAASKVKAAPIAAGTTPKAPIPLVRGTKGPPPGLTLESWRDPTLTEAERRRLKYGSGVRNIKAIQRRSATTVSSTTADSKEATADAQNQQEPFALKQLVAAAALNSMVLLRDDLLCEYLFNLTLAITLFSIPDLKPLPVETCKGSKVMLCY